MYCCTLKQSSVLNFTSLRQQDASKCCINRRLPSLSLQQERYKERPESEATVAWARLIVRVSLRGVAPALAEKSYKHSKSAATICTDTQEGHAILATNLLAERAVLILCACLTNQPLTKSGFACTAA